MFGLIADGPARAGREHPNAIATTGEHATTATAARHGAERRAGLGDFAQTVAAVVIASPSVATMRTTAQDRTGS